MKCVRVTFTHASQDKYRCIKIDTRMKGTVLLCRTVLLCSTVHTHTNQRNIIFVHIVG